MRRSPPLLCFLAASAFGLAAATPTLAQSLSCQIARAELAALERNFERNRVAETDQLIAAYHAAGCDGSRQPFLTARPAKCDQIHARIARLQADPSNNERAHSRRARLQATIDEQCGDSSLRASSRGIDSSDMGSSRIVIDENDQMRPAPSSPRPLGRAVCVRSCDGYYFPLTTAPGGREGADEMCQALCPASETRAYFLDGGSIDSATNGDGRRYSSSPSAYRFKRQISASCGCRRPGETWSKALQRADELAGPQAGATTTENGVEPPAGLSLRPSAGVQTQRRARLQAIDPEPLQDDGPLEPEFLPPEPRGMATMAPIEAPPTETQKPALDKRLQADGPRPPARVVGPPVKFDGGRPIPIAPPNSSSN